MSDPTAQRALARWLCCGHLGGCRDEAKNYRPPGDCEGLDLVNATPQELDLADVVAAAVREQIARDIEALMDTRPFVEGTSGAYRLAARIARVGGSRE